jgi:uncharacterized cupin superfamily protein
MADESFARRVVDLELEPAALDPETIVEGSPEVSELVLATSPDGRVVRGVWQIRRGWFGTSKPTSSSSWSRAVRPSRSRMARRSNWSQA